MALLDNLPHECTIRKRVRTRGTLGGSKDSYVDVQTGVACWEQSVSATEAEQYQKRGINVTSKVYFASDPGVTERHQIVVTKRNGISVASPVELDVVGVPEPDASVGRAVVWKVVCNRVTSAED